MIVKPTVLILGAGASAPYGYPLGNDLVRLIIEMTGPGGFLFRTGADPGGVLTRIGIDPADFHRRLRDSDVESIDDFLESNPTFQDFGKLCIAAALTIHAPLPTFRPEPQKAWYRYLWRRLHEGASTSADFRKNLLRVITYNYEKSFERYFTGVLASAYPDLAAAGKSAAVGLFNEVIPVLHLHGTLSTIADGIVDEADRTRWIELEFFRQTAKDIRIVHEDQSEEYDTAHGWLREAEVVHLLGFGFHATNVRRLDLVTQNSKRGGWSSWGGTAFGLEQAELLRAYAALQLGTNFLRVEDCLAYLRTHAVLD